MPKGPEGSNGLQDLSLKREIKVKDRPYVKLTDEEQVAAFAKDFQRTGLL